MSFPTSYMPEGFTTVTPFIMVENAQQVVNFVKRAFDAEEISVLRAEDGTLQHAQIRIGNGIFLIGDTMGEHPAMPATLYLYVADCDCHYERGLGAGGESVSEPTDQFYGDRNAGIKDPCGNIWWIATHKEALTMQEIEERARKAG
jgi:PhnB protein